MQYQINIAIDAQGVQQINSAGQYITMVKSVVSNPAISGNLPIAWVTFPAFMSNSVTWQELYYLYGTETQLQAGATIQLTSQTVGPAQEGLIYTFQGNLFNPGAQGSADTFDMYNANGGALSFGLAQQAVVNGTTVTSPLNAVDVLNDESASFTPIETVSIFLSSYTNNGVVISQVASNALTVVLTSQEPVVNVGFTDSTNQFTLLSQGQAFTAINDIVSDRIGLARRPSARR